MTDVPEMPLYQRTAWVDQKLENPVLFYTPTVYVES